MDKKAEEKYLKLCEKVIEEGSYKDDWDSLCTADIPKWFDEKRLGIFMHWGVYSVPASFNEWYSRDMYKTDMEEYDHHIRIWGNQKEFGYKERLPGYDKNIVSFSFFCIFRSKVIY